MILIWKEIGEGLLPVSQKLGSSLLKQASERQISSLRWALGAAFWNPWKPDPPCLSGFLLMTSWWPRGGKVGMGSPREGWPTWSSGGLPGGGDITAKSKRHCKHSRHRNHSFFFFLLRNHSCEWCINSLWTFILLPSPVLLFGCLDLCWVMLGTYRDWYSRGLNSWGSQMTSEHRHQTSHYPNHWFKRKLQKTVRRPLVWHS